MLRSPKIFAKILRDAADRIEAGSCGIDDDELMSVAYLMIHRKLNIEQCCQEFHVSRATIERWQQCGKFPEFKKDSGGKKFVWMDEAEEQMARWEQEHQS